MEVFKTESISGRAMSEFRRRFDRSPFILLGATMALSGVMGAVAAHTGAVLLSQGRATEALLRERVARDVDNSPATRAIAQTEGQARVEQDRIEVRQASPLRPNASVKAGAARAASRSRE